METANGAGAGSGGTAMNNTVYVHNIYERAKLPVVISTLTELFSEYGTVLEVVAKASLKRKGQAFVVFEDHAAAAKAIEEVDGFQLFGQELKLAWARSRSDAQVKKEDPEGYEGFRRARLAEKERKQAQEAASLKRPAATAAATAPDAGLSARPAKTARGAGLKSTGGAAAVVPDEYLPPNKILFVRDIPDGYDVENLTTIFQRFEGFCDLRLVPGRTGIAFVEYETEQGAISAKERTAGMQLGGEGKGIRVTFQRQ